jgi:hypothetical protein
MLTLNQLKDMEPGVVFATGSVPNSEEGMIFNFHLLHS